MPPILSRLQGLGEVMTQYGTHMALSLGVLIIGLLVVRWIDRGLRRTMPRKPAVTIFCNIVYIVLVMVVISAAAVECGAKPVNVFRFLSIVSLVAIGLMVFLRPFLPSMPFKVGNTIKASDLLGKVEAITFLNTRLRTFDGKTFFVPNRKILHDVVINYHFTETRRAKVDVDICYDQDLVRAKQVLEAVMIEDPRVKTKPGPVVYVLELADSCIKLGGRCWLANEDYWVARCDLLEKIKLRFDQEGIQFAFPQMELHFNPAKSRIMLVREGAWGKDAQLPPKPWHRNDTAGSGVADY
jgi:small conductance mechanosensitive channel